MNGLIVCLQIVVFHKHGFIFC